MGMMSAGSKLSHMLTPQQTAPAGITIQPVNKPLDGQQILFR